MHARSHALTPLTFTPSLTLTLTHTLCSGDCFGPCHHWRLGTVPGTDFTLHGSQGTLGGGEAARFLVREPAPSLETAGPRHFGVPGETSPMAPASIHAVGMRVGCGLGGDSPCHGHRRRHPPGSAGGSPGGPHAPSALQSHPKHRRAARSPAVPARVARAQSTRLTPASGPGPGTVCTADPSRGHRPEREGPRPGQRRAQQDTASRFSRRDPNATSSRDGSQGPGQNGAHSAWVSTRTRATRQRPGHCSIGRLAHSHPLTHPLTRPLAQTHTLMHTRPLAHSHSHAYTLTH